MPTSISLVTALAYAASLGDLEMVKLFMEKGADVNAKNSDGGTVLMFAARGGNLEVVKLLLEKGLDVNAKDKGGRTVLMFAASTDGGQVEVVKLLLEKGLDVNAKDKAGRTGTDVCCQRPEFWSGEVSHRKRSGR